MPCFLFTQAVRLGDLAQFNSALSANEASFKSDGTYSLISRLRQNVIKAGLRKIWLSYSRISFADIALKLHLDSPEDAEFLCAKVRGGVRGCSPAVTLRLCPQAIRDGVLEASLNHEAGYMSGKDVADVYTTGEPQAAFDRRIRFCLDVHNEAVKVRSHVGAPHLRPRVCSHPPLFAVHVIPCC